MTGFYGALDKIISQKKKATQKEWGLEAIKMLIDYKQFLDRCRGDAKIKSKIVDDYELDERLLEAAKKKFELQMENAKSSDSGARALALMETEKIIKMLPETAKYQNLTAQMEYFVNFLNIKIAQENAKKYGYVDLGLKCMQEANYFYQVFKTTQVPKDFEENADEFKNSVKDVEKDLATFQDEIETKTS